MTDTTQTVHLTIAAAYHEKAKIGLRKLRELHRENGGFTSLCQHGHRFTLTIKGKAEDVALVARLANKIESLSSMNKRLDTLMDKAGVQAGNENLRNIFEHARDIVNGKKP